MKKETKSLIPKVIAKTVLVCSMLSVLAASASAAIPSFEQVQRVLPEVPTIKKINETPIPGLYEIVTEENVLYIDASLKHLINGEIFEIATKKNITKPRYEELIAERSKKDTASQREVLKAINLSNAFLEKKGDGSRVVYIFTDPHCPFCKKLEETLEKVTNVSIYRFGVPMHGPASIAATKSAWCAKDQVAAWKKAMQKETLPIATCKDPVTENAQLGFTLKVSGTPTLFTPDGRKLVGAHPLGEVENFLNKK